MRNNTTLLAFGTFGSPNGFTQTAFYGNTNISLRKFDLNTNAIKLFPNTNLTAVRKELHGLSYSFYSFAREKGSTRGGTFIGSALYYERVKPEENISIEKLKSFHQYLVANNVANEEIKVLHSNELKTEKPLGFEDLEKYSMAEILVAPFTKNYIVVYDPNGGSKLDNYLAKAPQLFAKYDIIYFTADEQVAKYVQERGLFSITDSNGFDQEIAKIEAERKQKIQKTLADLQAEKQSLDNAKTELIQKIEKEIENQQKKHDENAKKIEETKGNISKISSLYFDYKTKLYSLENELKSSGEIDVILQKKRILKGNLEQNLRPLKYVSSISTISETRRVEPTPHHHSNTHNYYNDDKISRPKENKTFKIVFFTGIFAIVLFLVFAWWGYNKYNELEKRYNDLTDQLLVVNENQTENGQGSNNNFLNENDAKYVNNTLNLGKDKINDVVETIFKKNPTDIGKSYKEKKEYIKLLYGNNTECFKIQGNDTIITKPLMNIPKNK